MTEDVSAPVEETVDELEPQSTGLEPVEAIAPDEGDETGEAPAEVVDTTPPADAPPPPEPFTFKAFKQDYEVPGLAFDRATNAIVVQDPRGLDRLRQMLSHGREWEARGRQELVQLKRENETLRSQPHAELEHAKAYLAEFDALMGLDDESFLQRALLLKQQYPLLQAKAERAYAERVREQAAQMSRPPEPDVEVVMSEAQQGAQALVQELLQDQPWATPEIAAELTEYLQEPASLNQWIVRANRDLPEYGLRAGQYAADWDTARKLADRLLNPYRRAHDQVRTQTATVQQRAAETTKVARQNAAVLAQAKPAAKPAPKTTPTPPPASAASSRSALMKDVWKTWQEVRG